MGRRAIILILDSLGVGYMEDAKDYHPQDVGANTFSHILDKVPSLHIPTLEKLGINKILQHPNLTNKNNIASYGICHLMHQGADSFEGHNEIMGTKPKRAYLAPFIENIGEVKLALEEEGYKVEIPRPELPYLLVNDLVIVADNIETDFGQIYNVSAPLDYISFQEVLKIGQCVRNHVKVNRVIALGGENVTPEHLRNSVERREDGLVGVNSPKSNVYKQGYQVRHLGYGISPKKQLPTLAVKAGLQVSLVGKMQDVIYCEGANKFPGVDTDQVMQDVLSEMDHVQQGLIAATVQETDLAGHAQNPIRYANRIEVVEKYLPTLLEKMHEDDLLIMSADHGNDPTIGHNQHTREKTYLLAYHKQFIPVNLGERNTLSDIAATAAEYLGVKNIENGTSFLPYMTNSN
ncbi:phosphopentomutase [Heyndrickxia sporothermodurans]|uniref:phosphopentomutase n=1 Tax=Heyndrickxia sporothermodurans TaxID=46224 RepID=UPI002E1D1142|nr:phosphopentomutase [Heyndrickxia sporothermodurans]MED3655181.1 phosphopentomutase [Heyndrickxia sporothermodurans]